jgi:hypothetical protein
MAEKPQQVASGDWATVTYYPDWNTLELTWGEQTRSMSDDGFKETLRMLADQGLKQHPSYVIINAVDFFHEVGEGTMSWRDKHIVPLYNQAGVQKFAFLVTDRATGTVEKGTGPAPEGPAKFPTGWFETRDRMYAWLTG